MARILRTAAIAALSVGAILVAEGGARSLTGLSEMLGASAWQSAYRQDLALDSRPEAAELHLATYGWTGDSQTAVEAAICSEDEVAGGKTVGGIVKPGDHNKVGLGQPL